MPRQTCSMPAPVTLLIAMLASAAGEEARRPTVRDAVCAQKLPAVAGDGFSLLALPAPRRGNEHGVLLLVNCSSRKIVSLRDPSRSRHHLTEFVYDPRVRKRLRGDPHRYEFINFHQRPVNSAVEVNGFSRNTYWRGPCRYDGLELTTVDAANEHDRATITFSLDICRNQVLALVTP